MKTPGPGLSIRPRRVAIRRRLSCLRLVATRRGNVLNGVLDLIKHSPDFFSLSRDSLPPSGNFLRPLPDVFILPCTVLRTIAFLSPQHSVSQCPKESLLVLTKNLLEHRMKKERRLPLAERCPIHLAAIKKIGKDRRHTEKSKRNITTLNPNRHERLL